MRWLLVLAAHLADDGHLRAVPGGTRVRGRRRTARLRPVPLVLPVAVAAMLVAAAPAQARVPVELAVQDDPVFVRAPWAYGGLGYRTLMGERTADAALDKLGVTTVRVNVPWVEIEPRQGEWHWGWYDAAIDRIVAQGRTPQLTVTGPAPRWASGNGKRGNFEPDPEGFANVAGAIAARYGDRVKRIAVWNEPNWHSLLLPRATAPQQYRRLYRLAYDAIKAADPDMEVLFGELAPMGKVEAAMPPLKFLRGVFRSGPPLRADGFAHHPYTLRWDPRYPGPTKDDVTSGSLGRLTRYLRRLASTGRFATPAGKPPPLYLTEWGYHANSSRIREPLRSRYITEGLRLMASNRRVRQIVYYQLAGPPRSRTRIWDTALLDRDGRRRPAFRAVARWARSR